MKKLVVYAASIMFVANVSGQTYQANVKNSTVNWKGEKLTGAHTGTLLVKNGTVEMKNGEPVTVKMVMDMTSMVNTDLDKEYGEKLVGHLQSDDFFSVEKNPTASFESTKIEKLKEKTASGANYKVTGNLTIKGITNPVSFDAGISSKDNAVSSNGTIVFDRTKWDIKYGSGSFFDDLGDKAIYDNITLDYKVEAAK